MLLIGNNFKVGLLLVFILFSCSFISAQYLSIDIPKESYSFGESVSGSVIVNASNSEIYGNLRIDTSMVSLNSIPEPTSEVVSLESGEIGSFNFNFIVPEAIEEGTYDVTAILFDSFGGTLDFQSVIFNISGTKKTFNLNLIFNKKVLIQGEKVSIDYTSSVENLLIDAKLIYPDESEEIIELPAEIVVNQIGTYSVEVSASKEGYKDVSLSNQFGVIESDVEIEYTEPDAVDGGEKLSNSIDRDLGWIFWVIVGIIGLVILVVLFLIIWALRRR